MDSIQRELRQILRGPRAAPLKVSDTSGTLILFHSASLRLCGEIQIFAQSETQRHGGPSALSADQHFRAWPGEPPERQKPIADR